MLPTKFGSIWPSSFRGEVFLTLANQKQELEYQKSDSVKMISTARSNYPEILKKI
jgi:hypothetical protein